MSLNNLAIHHASRLSGQNSIAAMCLDNLEKGGIDEDCNFRKSSKRSREWLSKEGKPMNDAEFLNLVGIGLKPAERLFLRYKGDCNKIINFHGRSKKRIMTGIKYYDRQGNPAKKFDVRERECISHEKLNEFFKDRDYIAAYKLIDQYKAAKRANK